MKVLGSQTSRKLLQLLSLITSIFQPHPSAGATQVSWSGNKNVDPKHMDAHEAPRSQKYWDENGIERPDYAKTDAEIAVERRQKRGEDGGRWALMGSIMAVFYITFGVAAVLAIGYGSYTGDWSVILNNPVIDFVDQCIRRVLEAGGVKGHKLGSAQSTQRSIIDEEERRRLARLARFENSSSGRDILDSTKED